MPQRLRIGTARVGTSRPFGSGDETSEVGVSRARSADGSRDRTSRESAFRSREARLPSGGAGAWTVGTLTSWLLTLACANPGIAIKPYLSAL
jgi:hypothetical protein